MKATAKIWLIFWPNDSESNVSIQIEYIHRIDRERDTNEEEEMFYIFFHLCVIPNQRKQFFFSFFFGILFYYILWP